MMQNQFFVDEDIKRACTPSSELYTDETLHERSKSRVFAPSWQWIGDTGLVKVPGQVHPCILLDGMLDEPVLLTRGLDDDIHAMSNVCTHRGMLVCESGGNERFLRCRYHGRRFGLDGSFQHMPEFEQCENFPSASDSLPQVPFGRWGPWLFASLAPRLAFEDFVAPMQTRVGWMPLDEFTFEPTLCRNYLVKANWALYCENYLEGFHIPFIHQDLAASLEFGSYRTELFSGGTLQVAIGKGSEDTFDLSSSSVDFGQRIAAYYFWLFPNLMFNFYPWGCSINVVQPLGVDLTKVSFFPYVWDHAKMGIGAGASLDRVEREDEAVVESVQRGLRSSLYDRGRYSPTQETGTHHFHRMLTRALEL